MKNNSIKKIGKVLLLFLLIGTGCKVSEPYTKPVLNEPNQFYGNNEVNYGDSTGLADIHWKDFFNDPILNTLIDTALHKNLDLQITNEYIEIGLARLKQAKANFLPSITGAPAKYRRDIYSDNYHNWGSNRARRFHGEGNIPTELYTERLEYEIGVDLSWEIDVWGKLKSQKKAQLNSYLKSKEFQKALQTSLVADIATTYANLILFKAQLEVYRSNLSLNDSTLQMVKLQYDAGEVTSLAVKQTQSQKLRAQTLIPQLEREYIRQENLLNRLLGRYPEQIETGQLDWEIIDEEFVTGMPLQLISNRPDVAAAELNLQESYAKLGVASAMRYPSVNIGMGIGLNSFQLDKLLNPAGSGFLLLNGLVLQPIFQRRRMRTNYEVAISEKKIAELEFRNTFLQAINEVSNAIVTIEKLKEEYKLAQARVTAAQAAVKDAFLLFRSGMASYLEVITAQTEALDSELNLENVKVQIFSADVELYRSLGGGWK